MILVNDTGCLEKRFFSYWNRRAWPKNPKKTEEGKKPKAFVDELSKKFKRHGNHWHFCVEKNTKHVLFKNRRHTGTIETNTLYGVHKKKKLIKS